MPRAKGGRSPANIAHFLKDIDFPADKDDLLRRAQENDADDDILAVLQHIPEGRYGNMADVMKGVGRAV